jgi:hypothetical protein
VRLAQRIPVRVALDEVPADFRMIAGRTATVSVRGIGPSMGRRPAASDAAAASAASPGGASTTGAAIVGTAPASATHSASGASQ